MLMTFTFFISNPDLSLYSRSYIQHLSWSLTYNKSKQDNSIPSCFSSCTSHFEELRRLDHQHKGHLWWGFITLLHLQMWSLIKPYLSTLPLLQVFFFRILTTTDFIHVLKLFLLNYRKSLKPFPIVHKMTFLECISALDEALAP